MTPWSCPYSMVAMLASEDGRLRGSSRTPGISHGRLLMDRDLVKFAIARLAWRTCLISVEKDLMAHCSHFRLGRS